MSIREAFLARHPTSARLAERARQAIPGGVTHDIRHLRPFAPYIDRASGARKWDVDGNEYIDYWMGHGALFLGHCHPAVVEAVQAQVARGTHFGASHELEIRWAELVNRLVPCAARSTCGKNGAVACVVAGECSVLPPDECAALGGSGGSGSCCTASPDGAFID